MKQSIILFLAVCLNILVLHAQETVLQRFDTIFNQRQQEIAQLSKKQENTLQVINNNISLFSDDERAEKTQRIEDIRVTLARAQQEATEALQNIKATLANKKQDLVQQYGDDSKTINTELNGAIAEQLIALNTARDKFIQNTQAATQELIQISQDLKNKKAMQEAQKQYQAGTQAQQAREQLLTTVTPLVTQLSQLDQQGRTFFHDYDQSGTFQTEKAFALFEQYGTLVTQAAQAYAGAQVPIAWSDSAQYPIVIFKHMVAFFLSDVQRTVHFLRKDLIAALTQVNEYVTILKKVNVLLHRIYGSQGQTGYTQRFDAITSSTFTAADQQTVQTYTMQRYARMIMPFLIDLLSALAGGHLPLSEDQFKMVQLCHQELVRAADFIGKQASASRITTASNAMGKIAEQYAHALLGAIAIDDFGQSAHEAALQAFKLAESYYQMAQNDIDAQTVRTAQTNLNAALYYWALALQETDVKKAIQLCQQVYYFCVQIDDTLGAYKAYKQSQDLAIQATLKDAQEQIHTLCSADSSALKQWIAQVSADISQAHFDRKLLSSVGEVCDQVSGLYKTVIVLHLQSNVIATTEQEAMDIITRVKTVATQLNSIVDAFDNQASNGQLHSMLFNVRGLAALLDTVILDTVLHPFVPLGEPLFGQKTAMSWVKLIMRTFLTVVGTHVATNANDASIAQLATYALMYGNAYLTEAEQKWLRGKLATNKLDTVAQEAQSLVEQALKDDATAWQANGTAEIRMVDGLLRYQQLLFAAQNNIVQEQYIKAVDAYAEKLASQKDGGALWKQWFWFTIVSFIDPSQAAKAQKVVASIKQENDALAHSSQELNTLAEIQKKEQQLTDWHAAALSYAHVSVLTQLNGTVQKLPLTVAEHGQKIRFALVDAKEGQEMVFNNHPLLMAQMYERVAQAQEKGDMQTAQQAAQNASYWYARMKNEQKAQDWWTFMNRMMSMFIVDNYQQLVQAQGTTLLQGHGITGVMIPHFYTLATWKQSVPALVSKPFGADATALNQDAAMALTRLLFVYFALQEKGIDISPLMTGNTISAEKETDAQKKTTVQTVIDVVDQAIQYLKKRIEKNESTIHIEKQDNSAFPYALVITQQPVEAVPPLAFMAQPIYRSFPTALSYFQWITKLADPQADSVLYGTKVVPSLRDQTSFNNGKRLTMQAYLSQAGLLLDRINYIAGKSPTYGPPLFVPTAVIKKLTDWRASVEKLRSVKKDDMSVRIADYNDAYKTLKQYAQDGVISYVQFAAQYATSQQSNDFLSLFSDLYEYLGVIAEFFLVGDPQQELYFVSSQAAHTGVLADCIDCYTTAYSLDAKRAARLQSKIVHLCINAGNTVARMQKKYTRAVPFYKEALGVLQAMDKPDLKLIDEAAINAMKAYLFAALKSMQLVQQALTKPITITTGTQKETMSLETLVQQVGFCPNPNVAAQKCTAYQKIHDSFVDALIQLQDAQSWAQVVQKLYGGVKGADAQAATRQKQAQEKLKSYLATKKVNLDTIDAIKQLVTSKDGTSTITKTFSTIANETHKTVDTQQRALGFALLYEFMHRLFTSFGKLYMHYYMKGVESDDQLNQLISSLAVERSQVQGALQDWFGIS